MPDRNRFVMDFTDYSKLQVGDQSTLSRTITAEDIEAFAQLSGDHNPLHVDEEFGRKTRFRQPIAHGMLVASYVSNVVGTALPGPGALYLSQSLEFTNPVYVGDEITVIVRLVEKDDETRVVRLVTEAVNQDGELVVKGRARVMVLEERHHSTQQGSMGKRKENQILNDKVALITGASRGIGAATAKLLAVSGASVVVNYLQNSDMADKVVEEIETSGGKAIALQANVANRDEISNLVQKAKECFGPIDILVNNASSSLVADPFLKLGWEELQTSIDTILKGAFNCCQEVVGDMKDRKHGRIINVITSWTWGRPTAKGVPYVTAKSGLIGLSKALATELGPYGITVNMVSPGITETDLSAVIPERFKHEIAVRTPLRRIANPEDTAKTILFLASDAADFISGSNISISGGEIM